MNGWQNQKISWQYTNIHKLSFFPKNAQITNNINIHAWSIKSLLSSKEPNQICIYEPMQTYLLTHINEIIWKYETASNRQSRISSEVKQVVLFILAYTVSSLSNTRYMLSQHYLYRMSYRRNYSEVQASNL
jgi:hypothetical protein